MLRHWAESLDEWGDHEAVAYLISRGSNPSQYSRQIIANWREAEKEAIDRVVGTTSLSGRNQFTKIQQAS